MDFSSLNVSLCLYCGTGQMEKHDPYSSSYSLFMFHSLSFQFHICQRSNVILIQVYIFGKHENYSYFYLHILSIYVMILHYASIALFNKYS